MLFGDVNCENTQVKIENYTIMEPKSSPGEYSKSFITSVNADLLSRQALDYSKTIPKFADEAVYVYSFKENRMVYAQGWEETLGYKDDEITMMTFVSITCPEYAAYSNELNDKALKFLHTKTENLELYSFTIELKKIHKNGSHIPMIVRVGVFKSENGKVTEIIGRCQINRSIKFGKVMHYSAYGPEKSQFEEDLNKILFELYAISGKEKEALSLVAKGHSFKEIATLFNVTSSAIEKRILPMYKRFGVKSLSHLISFAYENHILP